MKKTTNVMGVELFPGHTFHPKARIADIAIPGPLKRRLERVVLEQRQRGRIREHGLVPVRRLLLVGPPGTGKTMTAEAFAGELGLPLFVARFDDLITGETASRLRLVFDTVQGTRGVYLFDGANDEHEVRRVLNPFLRSLERNGSDSLVLVATDRTQPPDHTLLRRFDAVLEYTLPSRELATRVMRARLGLLDTAGVEWPDAAAAAESLSHAEIGHACDQVAKDAVLAGVTRVSHSGLVAALNDRRIVRGGRTGSTP